MNLNNGQIVGVQGFSGFDKVYEKDQLIAPADERGYWKLELAGVLVHESSIVPWSDDLPQWPGAIGGIRERSCLRTGSRRCTCNSCAKRALVEKIRAMSTPNVVPDKESPGVSDEDAAQHVLDAAAQVFRGRYVPETERPGPSGFFLHLYLDVEYKERAATFEILDRHSLKFTWIIEPAPATRTEVVQTIDQLVQEAYDPG